MLKHVVMWKIKNDLDKEESVSQIIHALEKLPTLIPEIIDLEAGRNVIFSETAADVILISTFKDKTDLNTYQKHPDHMKVIPLIKKLACERRAVDFEY